MNNVVKQQLESLVGASLDPVNLSELQKETDKTCKVVNNYIDSIRSSSEEWLDVLNEVSSSLEEFVMDDQMQHLLSRLDKVIDGVYELTKD